MQSVFCKEQVSSLQIVRGGGHLSSVLPTVPFNPVIEKAHETVLESLPFLQPITATVAMNM